MRKEILALLVFILFGCDPGEKKQVQNNLPIAGSAKGSHSEGSQIFKTYCSGCHGLDLRGNSAPALVNNEWKYGSTKNLMLRNVTYGIPGTEMAAFQNIIDAEQISQAVDYIRSVQSSPPGSNPIPSRITVPEYEIGIEQIVPEGLETPWAIEFISDSKILISERKGNLRIVQDGILDPRAIQGTPAPNLASSTGGYMDIELDPDFDTNGWIYLAYSHSKGDHKDPDAPATTKIVRGKILNHSWNSEQTLFEVPDSLWVIDGNRWGCRFLFDSNGKLIFTIGDMARDMDSQNLGKATGKTFRINADGSIPDDNPYVNTPGALPAIYTLGNRNVQGLTMEPNTGKIWASEHGPMGGDELNILEAGANYGWPIITYGVNYDGVKVSEIKEKEGMKQPVHQWTPSIAICPIQFVQNSNFPLWKNDLLVGALGFQELLKCSIVNGKVTSTIKLLKDIGRVRDIKIAPDGSLYVVLNKPDIILRLNPIVS